MYNHSKVEKKWIKYWQDNKTFEFCELKNNEPKAYILDMFPYPSGNGLHVGHPKGYTFTDVYARYKKLNGYNILHPMGWDAFGLPAEQFALENKKHPGEFTQLNIQNFKNQLLKLGYCYDFSKEVNTTDPQFYKWTQWIFIQLYLKGLAEIKDIDVNWCEKLGTVLADEEVLTDAYGNKVSERGKYPVIKKPMRQWVLKITEYADQLIDDLELTDWPLGLKNIQISWIGRSYGMVIKFCLVNSQDVIQVFTTRSDTIFGVSFIAISIDHFISKSLAEKNKKIADFIQSVSTVKEYERNKVDSKKVGIFTGMYALHPITQKEIPIYIANYVLSNYGNGAVMGVPGCDKRDYLFAKEHNLEIIKIIGSTRECCEDDGLHINSDFINDLNISEAIEKMNDYLLKNKLGCVGKNYKLKDWLFSRQRYWGEPFPVVYDNDFQILIDDKIPIELPKTDNIVPSNNGQSPLSNLSEWVNVCIDGKMCKRETNTMPQWAGSCWYFLAYILKQKDGTYIPLNSPQAQVLFQKWMPVDLYVGGQEHAVLHLLYARFWYKFLYDLKIVPNKEPFFKIINQGMILKNGEKMSKSKGNIVNPDEIINDYGADTLRLYELFMGPITASLEWKDEGVFGIFKWVHRVYRLFEVKPLTDEINQEFESVYNVFVKNITNKIELFEMNLAISEMMVFVNECYKQNTLNKEIMFNFITILSCFAPFVSEEINEEFFKNKKSLFLGKWPIYQEIKILSSAVNIPIQVNGKNRAVLTFLKDASEEEVFKTAINDVKIKKYIDKKAIMKKIYVKNKILNLIVK